MVCCWLNINIVMISSLTSHTCSMYRCPLLSTSMATSPLWGRGTTTTRQRSPSASSSITSNRATNSTITTPGTTLAITIRMRARSYPALSLFSITARHHIENIHHLHNDTHSGSEADDNENTKTRSSIRTLQ